VQIPAGSGPGATGAQLPPAAAEQDLHVPQGPLEQQTPSVQKVLRHCAPELHAEPSGRRLVQDPAWQMSPVTQSVFWPHMVRQELVPQT
jgi:hypothetical protein